MGNQNLTGSWVWLFYEYLMYNAIRRIFIYKKSKLVCGDVNSLDARG
jgi:hypothetical protein